MRATMMFGHKVIKQEIEAGAYQRDVAISYSLAMRDPSFSAQEANAAIIQRWSVSGLERIKAAAWSGRWRGEPLA